VRHDLANILAWANGDLACCNSCKSADNLGWVFIR
jgi:hypothetical protein